MRGALVVAENNGGQLRVSLGLAAQTIDFALKVISALLRNCYCKALLTKHFLHCGICGQ